MTQAQSQSQSQSQADGSRFVVYIHDGDKANVVAFKVSPEQTAGRVLRGACKHFKIDPQR